MPHERDERWVYVALAVLAILYVIYKYGSSIDLPRMNVSFHGLGKAFSAIPYLAATLIGVFFQVWGRKKRAEAHKRMEAELVREGPIRQAQGITVRAGRRLGGSFQADIHLTRSALYVLDSAGKRDAMRIELRRSAGGVYVEDASLRPASDGGQPIVLVTIGGTSRQMLAFSTPDASAWWMDIRGALGKSTDVDAETRSAEEGTDEAEEREWSWPGEFTQRS